MKANEVTQAPEAVVAKTHGRWAGLAKRIAELCIARRERLEELCPNHCSFTADEKRDTLKAVCGLNKEIAQAADEMGNLESESSMGVSALLGQDPGPLVRTVLAVLTVARFAPAVSREARVIQDAVSLCGARDVDDSLAVRGLFRQDGLLYDHVAVSFHVTLDESGVRLKESSLNRLLGQAPDDTEMATEAVAMTSRWK